MCGQSVLRHCESACRPNPCQPSCWLRGATLAVGAQHLLLPLMATFALFRKARLPPMINVLTHQHCIASPRYRVTDQQISTPIATRPSLPANIASPTSRCSSFADRVVAVHVQPRKAITSSCSDCTCRYLSLILFLQNITVVMHCCTAALCCGPALP